MNFKLVINCRKFIVFDYKYKVFFMNYLKLQKKMISFLKKLFIDLIRFSFVCCCFLTFVTFSIFLHVYLLFSYSVLTNLPSLSLTLRIQFGHWQIQKINQQTFTTTHNGHASCYTFSYLNSLFSSLFVFSFIPFIHATRSRPI